MTPEGFGKCPLIRGGDTMKNKFDAREVKITYKACSLTLKPNFW